VPPRVLVELFWPCRSCRKLLRNDCSAAVEEVAADAPAADDPLAVDELLAAAAAAADVPLEPACVPPRSAINLPNAEFNCDSVFDDKPELLAPVSTWLLVKSLMTACSAPMMPCWPYFPADDAAAGVLTAAPLVAALAVAAVLAVVELAAAVAAAAALAALAEAAAAGVATGAAEAAVLEEALPAEDCPAWRSAWNRSCKKACRSCAKEEAGVLAVAELAPLAAPAAELAAVVTAALPPPVADADLRPAD